MPPPARVRILTLAREEIRSLPRSAFGMGAVAVVLSLFVPMAALAYAGPTGMREPLLFGWLVGALVVAILVASRVAAARRSRFVDSLYTTPLEQRTWFGAQVVVGLVLAALVLAIQLPFVLVHVAYLGIPAMLGPMVLAALLMSAFAIALGLFCGVAVGESGAGAAAGLAGGISFVAFVGLIFHSAAATSGGHEILLRVTALSPLALVVAGAGISLFGTAPAEAWRPLVGLAAMIVGLSGAAWIAYTRAQGPLGWEGRARGPQALVVALVALAVLTPVATAEMTYHELPDDDFPLTPGQHTQVAFVARGAAIHAESFTLKEMFDGPTLRLGEAVELDALVLVKAPEGSGVRGLRIDVAGSDAVRVVAGGSLSLASGAPHGHAPAGEGWDQTSEEEYPIFRVPVTVRAVRLETLGDSPALVEVRTQFVSEGRTMNSHAKITLDAELPDVSVKLALAGLPLPAAALAALVARRARTR